MQQRYGSASTNATALKNITARNLARLHATAHLTTFESIFFRIFCNIDRKYRVMNFHSWFREFYLFTLFWPEYDFRNISYSRRYVHCFRHSSPLCLFLPAKNIMNRSNIVYAILCVCAINSLRTFYVSVGLSLYLSLSFCSPWHTNCSQVLFAVWVNFEINSMNESAERK